MFYLVLRNGSVATVVEDLSSRHKTHKMSSLPSVALDPRDPPTSSSCLSYVLQLKIFVCLCLFYFTTLGLFAILGRVYTIYHQLFRLLWYQNFITGCFHFFLSFFLVLFSSHLYLYFINYGGWNGGSMSDMFAV